MTILTRKGNYLYIEKPISRLIHHTPDPFWSHHTYNHLTCLPLCNGPHEKVYDQYYIALDNIYGYQIDPRIHTIILLLRQKENMTIQFETQEEYDDAITCILERITH